ncbi:MAG: NAD(+)/NADH kinase, partial [Candidatus Heimdallarchaeota archaeon]|nr:NAD(+)/NADH kinase [Candidatus Heimdallarchaeota archaeon]
MLDVSHFLVTSSKREKAVKTALTAFNKLKESGYNVILDSNLDGGKGQFDESNQKIDVVLVFGGDGTILKTLSRWINLPILGVNCGRVGFLTEIEPDELIKAIEKFERNEFFYEEYTTLSVVATNCSNLVAVNDVIVIPDKTGRIITLKVSINGEPLYTFNGDGIIVASTTGSSAYSRSAGGPLIMPTVDAFSIVAI